jgi:hypothetical protein
MPIDIRFLDRLPAAFLQQYPDLMALREADANHDGFITEENNSQRDPSLHEASQFLERLAAGEGHVFTPSELSRASQGLMEEFQRVADPLREVVESRSVSLQPLREFSRERRSETHADYLFHLDHDFSNSLSAREFQSAILEERNPLIPCLRSAAEDQWRADAQHQYEPLVSIFHYVSYVPRHLIQAPSLYQGLETMWNYMFGEGDSLNPENASPYSWRGGVAEVAELRHLRRLETIDRFESLWRAHPEEGVNAILERLRIRHPEDVDILERDLRIHGWEAIQNAPSAQDRGRAALSLAQSLREGDWNFNYLGDRPVAEFLSLPWRNNNFALSRSIYAALGRDDSGMPLEIQTEATNARENSLGNGESLLINLLPWHWGETWSDETASFNNLWSETASFVALLAATRGAGWLLRSAGGAAWSVTGVRLATWMSTQGRVGAFVARVCGVTAEAAGTEVTTTATSEAVTRTTWQAIRGYAGSGFRLLGRGLNRTLTIGTYSAAIMAERQALRPPNREVDYQVDYSLRLSPNGDETNPATTLTHEDLETLALMNLVALHMNLQEEIAREDEARTVGVAELQRMDPR